MEIKYTNKNVYIICNKKEQNKILQAIKIEGFKNKAFFLNNEKDIEKYKNETILFYKIKDLKKDVQLKIINLIANNKNIYELIDYISHKNKRINVSLIYDGYLENKEIIKKEDNLFITCIYFIILLFLSPIFIIVSLFLKIENINLPIFFKQKRVGKNNKIFSILKFRSMDNSIISKNSSITSQKDPRITLVGNIIRKFKIDELSQIINVIKEDLYLIGPRPYSLSNIKDCENIEYFEKRHLIKPGITGLAQVKFNEIFENNYKNESEFKKDFLLNFQFKLNYDIYYVLNHNLKLDIEIIFLTFKKVFNKFNK